MSAAAFARLDVALADGPSARAAAARCAGCRYTTELEALDARGFCADCAPPDTDAELNACSEFAAWLDSRSAEALDAFERAVAEESTDD